MFNQMEVWVGVLGVGIPCHEGEGGKKRLLSKRNSNKRGGCQLKTWARPSPADFPNPPAGLGAKRVEKERRMGLVDLALGHVKLRQGLL